MPMVFEVRTAEIIQDCLPEIAKQLKRIADALEEKKTDNTEDKD